MRKIINLWVLLFISFGILNAQNNSWTWGNPLPQGNTLNSLTVLPNSNKCVAIGNAGTTMSFDFAQNNWTVNHGTEGKWQSLNSMYFINEMTGYAVGDTGNAATYLKTQTVDTTAGNKYVGTTSTTAELIVA